MVISRVVNEEKVSDICHISCYYQGLVGVKEEKMNWADTGVKFENRMEDLM